jgi:REP element-mobilizing transposase RayT
MSPPVLAYHLILTAYGFWLPNDPRGSWSDFVRAWELQAFGPATKTTSRRSLAHKRHDRAKRIAAQQALARLPVVFTGEQALAIGVGFAAYVQRSGLKIFAASILPRHSHLVVRRMPHPVEQTANLLKGAAATELNRGESHPFADQPYRNGKLPTPWAKKEWSRFLDCDEDIRRSIAYVENNPVKDGKPAQKWGFITPYERLQSLA